MHMKETSYVGIPYSPLSSSTYLGVFSEKLTSSVKKTSAQRLPCFVGIFILMSLKMSSGTGGAQLRRPCGHLG